MCHLYHVRFDCGHKNMIVLFCHRADPSELCDIGYQRPTSGYLYAGRCKECAWRVWDKRKDDHNEDVDNEFEQIDQQRDEIDRTELGSLVSVLNQRADSVDDILELTWQQEQAELRNALLWMNKHARASFGFCYADNTMEFMKFEVLLAKMENNPLLSITILAKDPDIAGAQVPIDENELRAVRAMLKAQGGIAGWCKAPSSDQEPDGGHGTTSDNSGNEGLEDSPAKKVRGNHTSPRGSA